MRVSFLMRKWLNHEIPWEIEYPEFFITICCRPRGLNQLCHTNSGSAILRIAQEFHHKGKWSLSILLLMPDHLHAIVRIPGRRRFSAVIGQFKQRVACKTSVRWQRGFFDHRIRHPGSWAEKFTYIQQNPVSAGHTPDSESWPWKWQP